MTTQYVSLRAGLPTSDSRAGLPTPTSRMTHGAFMSYMIDKHMPFRVAADVRALFEMEDVLRSPLVHSFHEAEGLRYVNGDGVEVYEVSVAHRDGVVVFICLPYIQPNTHYYP